VLEQTVKPIAVIMLMLNDVVLKSSGGLDTHITSRCVQIMLPYLRVELQWFGEVRTVYSRGSQCCYVPASKKYL
jgi:hypothetical protein